MLSGPALTCKQERPASDLCRWHHTKKPNFLKLWVLTSSFQKRQVCRDLGTAFPSPHKPRTAQGQRASCGVPGSANMEGRGFPSSLSKPGGNASTFTLDICPADTGGSLQKLSLGKHVLQGDALHFVKPHKQVGAGIGGSAAGTGTGMLDLSHRSLKAEIPRSKCTNGSPHYIFLF